jgi:hypothetical protein
MAGDEGTARIMPDNGICERFHKTVLNEFYRVAFRKKVYRSIEELQADLDIKGDGASAKRHGRPSLMQCR